MFMQSTQSPTLEAVFEEYLTTRRPRERTLREYRGRMRRCLSDWMSLPVNEITPEMIIKRHSEIRERTPTQANRAIDLLGRVATFAIALHPELQHFQNPVLRFKLIKARCPENSRKEHFVEPHDLRVWYVAVRHCGNQTIEDLMLVLLMTGLRIGEARHLKWSDVDLERRIMYVGYLRKGSSFQTKNGSGFRLPICNYLVQLLYERKLVSKSPFVFPCRTNLNAPIASPYKCTRRIQEASNVQFRPHDLRRTFVNMLLDPRVGVEEEKVGQFLNHTPKSVTMRHYATANIEARRPIYEKLSHLVLLELGVACRVNQEPLPEINIPHEVPRVVQSEGVAINAEVRVTGAEQVLIEAKIIQTLTRGRRLKSDFYAAVGATARINKFEMNRILGELVERGIIARSRDGNHSVYRLSVDNA